MKFVWSLRMDMSWTMLLFTRLVRVYVGRRHSAVFASVFLLETRTKTPGCLLKSRHNAFVLLCFKRCGMNPFICH